MRHLPSYPGRRFRAVATIATLLLLVLSGCGDDDAGNLFELPSVDAGDASLTPDHKSDGGSGGDSSSSDGSSTSDQVEPSADVSEGDATVPEDTGSSPPDVTSTEAGDAQADVPAIVDASDTGPDATDAGSDANDTGIDATDAGVDVAADASSDADAEVDAFDGGCDDGDACTVDALLANGTCAHVAITCNALDQCHVAGTCNPTSGLCSNPAKGDGVSCNDGSACTQTDTCQAGICTGGNPIVCGALDTCHNVGTCDPGSGLCSNPVKSNGDACSDGDACTQTDTCQAGICTGGSPVVCTALDQCHVAGTCTAGVCSNPAKPNDDPCNDGNACTQTDTCQTGICVGANNVVCPAPDQCHNTRVCDPSSGQCSNPNKNNGDGCDDGNACTQTDTCQTGVCTGGNAKICPASDCHDPGTCDTGTGICSSETVSLDTPSPRVCTIAVDGVPPSTPAGGRCSVGACVPTFMVVRVGDGSASLTNASTAVFVERRYLDPLGGIIETINMPIAVDGNNQPLTMSGTASSEGLLSRSADAKFVTLAGYGTAPGLASVASQTSANVNRIVGRIAGNGAIDTSTRLNSGFSANNVRGATSTDGTEFWVTGASSSTGGVNYTTLGATGSTLLIPAGIQPTNTRAVHIFGGNLYITSGASSFVNVVSQVGSGIPRTAPQAAVNIPMSTTGPQFYSFVFFDTDLTPGFDTLYVANDAAVASGGGIQKWIFVDNPDGGAPSWTLSATFNATLTTGVRGLAGMKTPSGIVLVATTGDTGTVPSNRILYYLDDGTPNPTPALIATSLSGPLPDSGLPPATALYRGVALAP